MKRLLHTIFIAFIFSLNASPVFAAICISDGGGEWSNPATWSRNGVAGVPQPGDFITIKGPDIVTIESTVDLSTGSDDSPTVILITGTLKFWPGPGCEVTNTCDVDLILDSGSGIIVPNGANIQHDGPGTDKDIYIGGALALNTNGMPFGPGFLPEDAPLPVNIVSFTGIELETSNLLKWQTASEENTEVFILERSADGRNDFTEIGSIEAVGFTNEIQNYKFEDRTPLDMAYYRLKVMDFDGSFEYSDIIVVENSIKAISDFEVYPIPVQSELNISLNYDRSSDATLILTNYLGQQVLVKQLQLDAGNNQFTFEWNQLKNSFYILTVETEKERLVQKIF